MKVSKDLLLAMVFMFVSSGICFAQGGPVGGGGPQYSGGPVHLNAIFLSDTEIYYNGSSEVTQNYFVAGESVVKVRNQLKLYRVHSLPPGVSGPVWLEHIMGAGSTQPFTQTIETETHSTSIFGELPAVLPLGDYRASLTCKVAPNGTWIFQTLGDVIYFDLE